jgi:hypothetical protein
MTIPERSIDGFSSPAAYQTDPIPLIRTPKVPNIAALYDEKPTPKGLDLFQNILWGLELKGITLDNDRAQKIKKACLEP